MFHRLTISLITILFLSVSSMANGAIEHPTSAQITLLFLKSKEVSPELKVARNYRLQKGAESYTRLTDFFPTANLTLKRQRDFYEERNLRLEALGIKTGIDDTSWGVDYRWTLFNFGLIQNNRKTQTEKDKAEIDLLNKEKEYLVTFHTNLLNYLLAKYKMASVENSLKKAETGKREANLGFDLGQKTRIDVLRSDANVVSLDSKKSSFIDEVQNTKSRFLEYSGLLITDLAFLEDIDENKILELINLFSVHKDITEIPSIESSPVLKSLRAEEHINRLAISNLTASQWPELHLQGSFQNSAETFDETLHSPNRSHTVALILTIPLFNGGSLLSSHFEEYFAKKQIEYKMARERLQTENELSNTFIKIGALEKLVDSLALNVSQFEELYKLTLKSYQLGKSTLFELLDVQDKLLDSKINLAQNKISLYTLSENYLWQAGIQ